MCNGIRPLFFLLLLILSGPSLAEPVGGKTEWEYKFELGDIPSSSAAAVDSRRTRSGYIIVANACGKELEFLQAARDNDGGFGQILGKMLFLNSDQPSGAIVTLPRLQECKSVVDYDLGNFLDVLDRSRYRSIENSADEIKDAIAREAATLDAVNNAFVREYGGDCENSAKDLRRTFPDASTDSKQSRLYTLAVVISDKCLRTQVNAVLASRTQYGKSIGTDDAEKLNPGTDGLPCRIVGKARKGDWDMAVTELTRIFYVNKDLRNPVLKAGSNAYTNVDEKLLSLSEALQGETYGALSCGNNDNTYGTAEERAAEADFYDKPTFQTLGDIGKYALSFLVILTIFGLAMPFLQWALPFGAAVGMGGATVATVLVTGAITFSGTAAVTRIPESENHLLMINSSKYLKNKLIISELKDDDDKQKYVAFNKHIKTWLLEKFQGFIKEDFNEYNSMPYGRLSVGAILNIYDFSNDDELRSGAQLVLDYLAAKMALSSNGGRRIVPFRRLAGVNSDFAYGEPKNQTPKRLFDLESGADTMVAAMLYWTGQSQHMLNHKATAGAVGQMINYANSQYAPDPLILDIAMDKTTPYEQAVHHAGWEAYSSGTGWLVSAGGTSTGLNKKAQIVPGIEYWVPFFLKDENKGAGVPTTLIPLSSGPQDQVWHFLRFLGHIEFWKKDIDSDAVPMTYDDNLCVRNGFACGINLAMPLGMDGGCLKRPDGTPEGFSFISSADCGPFADAPPFFIVLYQKPCSQLLCSSDLASTLSPLEACLKFRICDQSLWGFFEVVSEDQGGRRVTLPEIADTIIARNPSGPVKASDAEGCPGGEIGCFVYHSWRDERILFAPTGHRDDSSSSGVISVEPGTAPRDKVLSSANTTELEDQPFLSGDIMNSSGDGRIVIASPSKDDDRQITLDFTDVRNPHRVQFP